MAALSQNLVRFEHDGEFQLIFTVTNAGTIIGASNFCAWWGLGSASTVAGSSSTPLKEAFTQAFAYDVGSGPNDCSAGGANDLDNSTADLAITVDNTTVTVAWTFAQFADLVPTNDSTSKDYYHELVLMERVSSTCYQCRSQVVAAGVLTVTPSLFTNRPYR